jgi:hypothetical protein
MAFGSQAMPCSQATREYTRGSPLELLHMQVDGGFERRIWSMKLSFMPP